ncbi:hypothetical protein T552_00763 [Pneumocystis carinii B80]|uniref:Mitochondrial distribution and morphology protein 35 n=1 Tax=Pneumocystis carinii (strain B80) TaxID=1408658 RepID=A0A0W4ZPK9_PNEC8|nr:hypothetical protein T552_00763 [Pneumocystis carinii B80]KTW30288.1 hypothetical protein T552_00763 [Pneumocystis carinii B80]
MASSINPECNELKQRYDTCFNNWYTNRFLQGSRSLDECNELFQAYKACFMKVLHGKPIMELLNHARTQAPFEEGGKRRTEDS